MVTRVALIRLFVISTMAHLAVSISLFNRALVDKKLAMEHDHDQIWTLQFHLRRYYVQLVAMPSNTEAPLKMSQRPVLF